MDVLTIKGLSKKYENFQLKDVSFTLEAGSIMGFIGRNGAGKSTTIKSMLNMVHPDAGEIKMLGKDFIIEEAECKQQIGVVFGGIDYYMTKKIKDITKVTKGFYREWSEEIYQHYLLVFGLDENKKVSELSAGMRVKYMIAVALSHNAKLFIFDEPTSGLDPVSRDELLEIFKKLVEKKERSILFSTHITSDLEKCATHITYIKEGEILESDTLLQFQNKFQYLKENEKDAMLSLEEIMVKIERREYQDDAFSL